MALFPHPAESGNLTNMLAVAGFQPDLGIDRHSPSKNVVEHARLYVDKKINF